MIRLKTCAGCVFMSTSIRPNEGFCAVHSQAISLMYCCNQFKEKPMDDFDKRAFLIAVDVMFKSGHLTDDARKRIEKDVVDKFGFEVK